MNESISRRDALKHMGIVGAGLAMGGPTLRGLSRDIVVAGRPVELAVASLSRSTVRLTLRPLVEGRPEPVPFTGALVQDDPGSGVARGRSAEGLDAMVAGDMVVRFTDDPPTILVETPAGETIQRLTLDAREPGMSFLQPRGPLLGLGASGEQFDRKGTHDRMRNGQVTEENYSLAIHGTRMPVQWLVGTDGWGLFIHQPYGAFDFRGDEGVFTPWEEEALPLDLFVVRSDDPKEIMAEYARIMDGVRAVGLEYPEWRVHLAPWKIPRPGGDARRWGGSWRDYWTEELVEGGRELSRPVNLETMPLCVRAGAVIPMGPVTQWAGQEVAEPPTLVVYPGSDGRSSLYEDDGLTFDYRTGVFCWTGMGWEDASRRLSLTLRDGSRMLQPGSRPFRIRVAGEDDVREVRFDGSPLEIEL